jgi:hypothetical protein
MFGSRLRQQQPTLPVSMMWLHLSCAAVSLLLWLTPVAARVVHVPGDALTVQAGLDDLTNGDTVEIARAVYPELLTGPPLSYVMIGEFEPDSGEAARPFVCATGLPGADTTGVFSLARFSRVIIENLRFQNGPMPDSALWYHRGIRSWADGVTMRNCVVDSTCNGFWQEEDSIGAVITLEDCEFRENLKHGVFSRTNNVIHAHNCSFTSLGTSETMLAICVGSSSFANCIFRGLQLSAAVFVLGQGFVIENCVFGPCQTTAFQPVIETQEIGGYFGGNHFQDCVYGSAVIYLRPDPNLLVEVRGNTFERCRGTGPQAFGVINVLAETDADTGSCARITDNVFTGNNGTVVSNGVFIYYSKAILNHNRFEPDSANGLPSVCMDTAWTWFLEDSVLLRDNLFSGCGYAAVGCSIMDARQNWWGDASGPYHEGLNPDAMGDTIAGSLQFIPWYTDTNFTVAREPKTLLPHDLQLSVAPNPFNPSTSIRYDLPRAAHVTLRVVNVLGREVAVLADEMKPAGSYHVTFDGTNLSSGVYFVRLEAGSFSQTRKLVLLK